MNRALRQFTQANRNIRVLGAVTLLVLGSLILWLVFRPAKNVVTTHEKVQKRRLDNEHVTRLVQSGATSAEALDGVAALFPYKGGFIGVTEERFTLADAGAFAEKAGADVLDIALTAQESRKEIAGWLAASFPDVTGSTTWVRENRVTRLIDAPDVLPLPGFSATPTSSRPHRAFLRWPRRETWQPKGWSWVIPATYDEALPFTTFGVARVRKGKSWGVIDTNGNVVQPISLDLIEPPEEEHGSYRVRAGDKWGVLDPRGRTVTPPEWDGVQPLIRGFAPVQRGGKWGYVDAKGTLVVPCEWDDAWRFSSGGHAIVTRARKRGIIDRQGRVVVPPVWDGAIVFGPEGVAMVRSEGAGWSLVDTSGRVLGERGWDVRWKGRRWIEEGFVSVEPPDNPGSVLLDLSGRRIPNSISDMMFPYSRHLFTSGGILVHDPSLKLISREGEEERDIGGKTMGFSEGLALVTNESGSGFIDPEGRWIIGPREVTMGEFRHGLAPCGSALEQWEESNDGGRRSRKLVKSAAPWGFIGKDGEWVIPAQWDEVGNFSARGLARVRLKQKWGVIDRTGKPVLASEWDEIPEAAGDFDAAGVIRLRKEGLWGLADTSGKILRSPTFEEMRTPADGLLPVLIRREDRMQWGLKRRVGLWSLIDTRGQTVAGDRVWETYFGSPSIRNGTMSLYASSGPVTVDRDGREGRWTANKNQVPMVGGLTLTVEDGEGYLDAAGLARRLSVSTEDGTVVLSGGNTRLEWGGDLGRWNWLGDFTPQATPPKYGLMNASGQTLVTPTWEDIRILSPQHVWFKLAGKCGLADGSGKVVVPPEWDTLDVLPVRSGSMARDGKNILVGAGGEAIQPVWIKVTRGAETHILRPDGTRAIPESVVGATYVDFYGPEHLVITQPDGVDGKLWSLYEPATGKQTKFPGAATFRWNWNTAHVGLLWQKDKDAPGDWRLMTKDGQDTGHTQPEPEKPDGWGFTDGRAPLHKADGWTFVGSDVKPVSTDRWDEVRDFSEERAAVRKGDKWGFVGLDGRVVVAPEWAVVGDYSRGLAPCKGDGFWGYLGKDGKVVIPHVWDAVHAFAPLSAAVEKAGQTPTLLDVALVEVRGKIAVIDPEGRLLTDPKFRRLFRRPPGGLAAWAFVGPALSRREVAEMTPERFGVSLARGIPTLEERSWAKDAVVVSSDRSWTFVNVSGDADQPGEIWQLSDATGAACGAFMGGRPVGAAGRGADPLARHVIIASGRNEKFGIVRRDGSVVVPPEFDTIAWVGPDTAAAWHRDGGGLVTAEGNWVFRDNADVRVARFEQRDVPPIPEEPGERLDSPWRRYRHGLVAIEETPKWGFARLNR